jgi:hypothetical protein
MAKLNVDGSSISAQFQSVLDQDPADESPVPGNPVKHLQGLIPEKTKKTGGDLEPDMALNIRADDPDAWDKHYLEAKNLLPVFNAQLSQAIGLDEKGRCNQFGLKQV